MRFAIDKSGLLEMHKRKHMLGVGFRVQVKIITGENKSVPIIPAAALFRGDDGS